MLLKISDLKDLLQRSQIDNAEAASFLTIRRGQLEGEQEFSDGRKISVIVNFEVKLDQGIVEIEYIPEAVEAPEFPTTEEIQLIVDHARGRARAYGIQYGSEKQVRELEEWLYARLYEGKIDDPPKQFFKLNEAMGNARGTAGLALSGLPIAAMSTSGTQLHLPAIALTLAYCWETEKELANNNVAEASIWVSGVQRWSSDGFLIENPNGTLTERAAKGGQARAKRHYEWIKEAVGDELRRAPPHSLKNMSQAARYLIDKTKIWEYYEENKDKSTESKGAHLTQHNFEKKLFDWIREDKELRKLVVNAKRA